MSFVRLGHQREEMKCFYEFSKYILIINQSIPIKQFIIFFVHSNVSFSSYFSPNASTPLLRDWQYCDAVEQTLF